MHHRVNTKQGQPQNLHPAEPQLSSGYVEAHRITKTQCCSCLFHTLCSQPIHLRVFGNAAKCAHLCWEIWFWITFGSLPHCTWQTTWQTTWLCSDHVVRPQTCRCRPLMHFQGFSHLVTRGRFLCWRQKYHHCDQCQILMLTSKTQPRVTQCENRFTPLQRSLRTGPGTRRLAPRGATWSGARPTPTRTTPTAGGSVKADPTAEVTH